MHCIFSTKERFPFIDAGLEARLWPYMGGIARENKMRALAIGGTADHLHTLLSLPATMDVAKAVQLIKGGSSRWVHDEFSEHREFAWQEGFGAFSVSASQVNKTVAYINAQRAHHCKRTFEEEFMEFLDRHGVEYIRRYVFR
jgi:REP element-mobilizing transposase RayT